MQILLIDDEIEILRALGRIIKRHTSYHATMLAGVKSLEEVNALHFDLVISDQRMPGYKGTEIFQYLRKQQHPAKRVLLSTYTDFGDIVASFNNGDIDHFLSKPIANQAILSTLEKLLYTEAMMSSNIVAQVIQPHNAFADMLTADPEMHQLFARIKQIAQTDTSVCITGETGTGKELLARAIHDHSARREGPFIALNCANLADELADSHLFGHEQGAFAGATEGNGGSIEQAHQGTLFLDEVTELPPRVQSKLLRTLQEKAYRPLGSSHTKPFDARILSATATPLRAAVSSGCFREDLLYRLNVVPLKLPPLRTRVHDKEPLFRHFLSHYSRQQHVPSTWVLSATVQHWLNTYHWPGNIRELQNICAYITSYIPDDQLLVEPSMLPDDVALSIGQSSSRIHSEPTYLMPANMDKAQLAAVLQQGNYNKAQVARQLGMSRMMLHRLLRRYNLEGKITFDESFSSQASLI